MDTFFAGKSDPPCFKQDQISLFVSSAVALDEDLFRNRFRDVNIHSDGPPFFIHIGPESIFTSRRNPYSHHSGTVIHIVRNPQPSGGLAANSAS
jgi:hypothetical protein